MIYFKNKILLMRDCSGNFALLTAFLIPLIFGAVGLSIDFSHLFLTRSSMQAATDAAIMTAAAKLSVKDPENKNTMDNVEDLIRDSLEQHLNNLFSPDVAETIARKTPIEITKLSASPTVYEISASPEYDMPLNKFSVVSLLTGKKSINIAVNGVAEAQQEESIPVSIELVLDVSGSMGSLMSSKKTDQIRSRLDVLKEAVITMMDVVEANALSETSIRMGISAFSGRLEGESPLSWGNDKAEKFVRELKYADGKYGTDSSVGLESAYKALASDTEDYHHASKHHKTFKKYIIFMTDGMNTYTDDDTNTEKICLQAQQQGIEIFTISVGLEPFSAESDRVTRLMKICASSVNNYHNATHATGLMEAFQNIGKKMSHDAIILKN
ncbi:hypothetical protein B488_07930 [Liberibacter crescens BT-1]|uniref:VWFA domain-containing protein n=1 Tax=Liberibacter crescens (strain BT-1) TaxID=1215343 RepID=L0EVA5_LIBCB|nr:TadE/TadG family type IV pilus assembly protein [Liberibacter crescens]AGA64785.1 hypothetical protein B488_07930 [Liberibacter crescens BT-1]